MAVQESGTTVVPRPLHAERLDGVFRLGPDTRVRVGAGLGPVAALLREALRAPTGFALETDRDGAIDLAVDDGVAAGGYTLRVTPEGIRIRGGDPCGVFHATQTLRQLLPPPALRRAPVPGVEWGVPAVAIEDSPRFAWRGLLLDVARHFVPVHEVLRLLDLMALHRLNVLHLHLTDDQGWRLQVPRYPRLTEVGAWRAESRRGAARDAPGDERPHGGYYTHEDVREIVSYASERFITVVPEIESPGHVRAAVAAYPELGVPGAPVDVWTGWGIDDTVLNMEEPTLEFVTDVLDEVIGLFDSEYIGIGGDECPRHRWRDDPRTRRRMAELGLADEKALQSWYVRRLDAHLTSRGRRAFGWDEILEGGLAPGATVASWRGDVGALAAARAGHDVVACSVEHAYLDYRQSEHPDEPIPVGRLLTVDDVYSFEPVPAGLDAEAARHVIGCQANLWTEHLDSVRARDDALFPRLCALAEVAWAPAERDPVEFTARLEHHLRRLDALGVEYRTSERRRWSARPDAPGRPQSAQEVAASMRRLTAGIRSGR